MGGVQKIVIWSSWTHVGGQIGPKSGNWAISLKMQLFSKTEKPHFETSSGLQDKSNYWYFTKKSPKKVAADPILAHSVKFTKLAKMAIFGWKLEKFEIFFSQNWLWSMTIIWLLYQILLRQILPQLLVPIAKIADFPVSQIFNKPPPMRPCLWPQIQIGGGFGITIDGAFTQASKLAYHEIMGDPLFE